MKSIAPRPRRNRRCSKPCRSTPSPAAPRRTSWKPPFLVMATQNPIEMEGTYPLPEAQLDRFLMKILVTYPSRDDLNTIVERTIQKDETSVEPVLDRDEILGLRDVCHQVLVAPHVQDYAIDLVMATQPGDGAGARAGQQIHPLRQFAARRAGAGRMRARAGADERAAASLDRGHRDGRARGAAPSHHSEFRRTRRRADPGNHPRARSSRASDAAVH